MFIEIETTIKGNFKIKNDIEIKQNPLVLCVRYNEIKKEHTISIKKKINNYSSQLPRINTTDDKKEIILPSNEFIEESKKILQHIESFGAIDVGVEKIQWEKCKIKWIPETIEEENQLQIESYERNISYISSQKILTKNWLSQTLLHRNQLAHLYLPFTFFREGASLYHEKRYQNSFLNFYLMLEGFFCNGSDYRNKTVKRDFLNSDILDYAINETITNLRKSKNKHYLWLEKTCNHYNKNIDKEGVVYFIVELRGNLSHFSLNDSREQRNPFKEDDYNSLAYITMSICLYSSIKLRSEPFKKKV